MTLFLLHVFHSIKCYGTLVKNGLFVMLFSNGVFVVCFNVLS